MFKNTSLAGNPFPVGQVEVNGGQPALLGGKEGSCDYASYRVKASVVMI